MITKVRKAKFEDISQVVKIYDDILKSEEEGKEKIGWIRGVYPTETTALEALKAEELFVMTQNEIVVAAARINQTQVPEYKNASWKYNNIEPNQVMVLHTLVVNPNFKGKGYGSAFVKFYEDYAKENNCLYLRMDTNAKNIVARKLYKNLGYLEVGIVPCIFNGIPNVQLVCLEKMLK